MLLLPGEIAAIQKQILESQLREQQHREEAARAQAELANLQVQHARQVIAENEKTLKLPKLGGAS